MLWDSESYLAIFAMSILEWRRRRKVGDPHELYEEKTKEHLSKSILRIFDEGVDRIESLPYESWKNQYIELLGEKVDYYAYFNSVKSPNDDPETKRMRNQKAEFRYDVYTRYELLLRTLPNCLLAKLKKLNSVSNQSIRLNLLASRMVKDIEGYADELSVKHELWNANLSPFLIHVEFGIISLT